MKKAIGIFSLFLLSIVLYEVISYSTYGAPAEFGNASLTTCYVGGDLGIINCTGNITTTSGFFIGNGSLLTGVITSGGGAGNCSAEGICSLVTYDTELQNNSVVRSQNTSWITDNQNLIANCSVDTSCNSITYDSELAYINNCSVDQSCDNVIYTTDDTGNTTLEIREVCYANVTAGKWILPEHILDVDKENIEGDMNTFVDIPGDEMTGDFNVSGARAQFKSEDGDGKIAVIIDGDGEATDFPLVIRAGTNPAVLGYSDRVCTVNHVGNVNCSDFYGTEFYLNDVAISTTHTEIRASILTNVSDENTSMKIYVDAQDVILNNSMVLHDNKTNNSMKSYVDAQDSIFNSSMVTHDSSTNDSLKIYLDAQDIIFNSSMVTHDSSTNTSMKSYVDEFRSLADDTSPQLGGYLDANGNNIGSTSDEIENIYIGVNTKLYLGDGQEGEVFWDGTKLIIKVN